MLHAVAAIVAAGMHQPGQLGDRQPRLEPRVEGVRVAAAR
jgi:hypothetical protein